MRVFSQLGSVLKNCDISIHLVEVSQKLSEIQALTLTEEKVPLEREAGSPVYMKGVTKSGIPISWYRDLQDVPKGYSFYLAHEFLTFFLCISFRKHHKDGEKCSLILIHKFLIN